jgi:antitoxin YefM
MRPRRSPYSGSVSKHGNAVLVSAEDYAALREGAYLLRSPANARRLLKA